MYCKIQRFFRGEEGDQTDMTTIATLPPHIYVELPFLFCTVQDTAKRKAGCQPLSLIAVEETINLPSRDWWNSKALETHRGRRRGLRAVMREGGQGCRGCFGGNACHARVSTWLEMG